MGAIWPLVPTQPTTTGAVTYYVCPNYPLNRMTLITSLTLSNNSTTTAHAAFVYNVPPGGSAGAPNMFIPGKLIPLKDLIIWEAGGSPIFIVPAGGSIVALTGASDVNITVCGEEMT